MEHSQETIQKTKNTFYFWPLFLTTFIVALDQISKLIIIKKVPLIFSTENSIIKVLGDFLWIIHITNKGAIFSIGSDFVGITKSLVLIILPILLLIVVTKMIVYSDMHRSYRWILAGILGGGLGNMIDRIFRPTGVVDWISVNVYGFFGFDRWPTFNVADSTIVVCIGIWLFINVKHEIARYKYNKQQKKLQSPQNKE